MIHSICRTNLLTNCEITVAVFKMKSLTASRTRPPGRAATKGTLSQVELTKQIQKYRFSVLKSSVARGRVMGQRTWSENGSHSYKVVQSYLDTQNENFSVRPSWTLLEPDEILACQWVLLQFQVELRSRQRRQRVSESPSSPSYVTVSMTTREAECRRFTQKKPCKR